jgi:hypothetical protein
MNTEDFTRALGQSRNGTDQFHFNPLYRWMHYSDGVKEVAESGCYWLLDILGTELPDALRSGQPGFVMLTISVEVKGSKCRITATTGDEDPALYTCAVEWTDLPEGKWDMLLTVESSVGRLILLTEY